MENKKLEETIQKIKKELYINNKQKGVLDALQEKIISRKLLVFLASTGLLIWSNLESDIWGMIAIVYIGGQSVIDAVRAYRHG